MEKAGILGTLDTEEHFPNHPYWGIFGQNYEYVFPINHNFFKEVLLSSVFSQIVLSLHPNSYKNDNLRS